MLSATNAVYGLYGDQQVYGAQSHTAVGSNYNSVAALTGLSAPRSSLLADSPALFNPSALSSRYTDSVSLSTQGKVQSALSDFRQALSALSGTAVQFPVKVSSDNANVVTATASASTAVPISQQVTVNQLASAQQIQTTPDSNNVFGTGTLRIQLGRVSASGFQASGAAKSLVINPANDTLAGVVASINQAGLGVTAAIVTDSNGSRLQLTGQQTGDNAAFQVSVQDDDGSNSNNTGLSRLAYTPGASNNSAQATQAAQNASVTVDGRTLITSGNTVHDVQSGTTLTLQGTGSANLSFTRDTEALSKSLHDAVSAFNSAHAQLSKLDVTQSDVAQSQLDRATAQLSSTLAGVGVTLGSDGSLKVDESKLSKVLQATPESVGSAVATAEQVLDQAAQRAQGTNLGISLRPVNNLSASSLQALTENIGPFSLLSVGGFNFALNSRTLYGLSQYLRVSSY